MDGDGCKAPFPESELARTLPPKTMSLSVSPLHLPLPPSNTTESFLRSFHSRRTAFNDSSNKSTSRTPVSKDSNLVRSATSPSVSTTRTRSCSTVRVARRSAVGVVRRRSICRRVARVSFSGLVSFASRLSLRSARASLQTSL